MKTLTIVALLAVAICASYGKDAEKVEEELHNRMHISQNEVDEVAEKKKELEKLEEEKEKSELPGPEAPEIKEDPLVAHLPSESDDHKEDKDTWGDEELTPDQVDEMIKNAKEHPKNRRKRQFQTDPRKIWQTDIDFYVDGSLDRSIVGNVNEGMKWINDNTCFNMRQVYSKRSARKPYITFADGTWCQSFVGKVSSDEQIVQMIPKCATVGTIIHEFLHALGFFHEQSRDDRDRYVRINMHNVKGNAKGNFEAEANTNNFGTKYIFGSVMAYPGKAFSIDGERQTIVANDQKYQRSMGHRVTGSFADAKRINTAYQCMDKCPRGPNCKNGGFRHPKQCSQCKCPEGFSGTDCSKIRPPVDPTGSNRGCGGEVQVSTTETRFVLKADANKQDKAHYCTTHFKAPAGKVIRLRMAKENGDWMACSGGCNWGYVELNPGVDGDYTLPGYRDCCLKDIETRPIVTSSGLVVATVMSKEHSAQMTVYATAVSPGHRGSVPTTKAPKTNNGGGGGGGGNNFTFSSQTAYNNAIRCSNDCKRRLTGNNAVRCHNACLKRYAD